MTIPIERLLQLSAVTPLIELRRYLFRNPDVTPTDAVAALLEIDETFVASDHEAALALHDLLDPKLIFDDFVGDLRQALARVVVAQRPQWAKRVLLGRARFFNDMEKVDTEVRRCFREAGLFDEDPGHDVVHWWDCLTLELRGIQNFENLMQGRAAEQKSLEVERIKLKHFGIGLEPKWQAIDDNTVGYDILSYRPGKDYPTNLLIEVKSSSRNPPAVIISREEWKKAQEAQANFVFHVWDIRSNKLHEWTFDMIRNHIPFNKGEGKWTSVEVPLKALS
jgi:hypothetical protein